MTTSSQTNSSSSSSSLATQPMQSMLDEDTATTNSSSSTESNTQEGEGEQATTPPALTRLNLNLGIDGLLAPEDIVKVYDESVMTDEDKRRLLMSVYKYAKPTAFGDDSLKTVKRICNEHIVRNMKFINGEFLNDMNKTQRLKATAFGTVYQPDFSDKSPSMWNDILHRMPGCTSMSLQMKAVTWMGILPTVKATIRGYRNNVQSKIKGKGSQKDSLISALQTINTQGFEATYTGDDLNLLLGLKTIQALAEGFREDNLMKIRDKKSTDVFRAFVHYFLQHTIPKADWISARGSDLISNIFTPVDEGFAILLIINHWQEWKHVAEGNVIDRRKKLTLYTHCYKDNNSGEDSISHIRGNKNNSSIPRAIALINGNNIILNGSTTTTRSKQGTSLNCDDNASVASLSSTATTITGGSSTSLNGGGVETTSKNSFSVCSKKASRTPKVKGWSIAGLRKYSEICKHVTVMRKAQGQETIEKALLAEYQKIDEPEDDEMGSKKRKRTEVQDLDILEEEPFNMYSV